MKKIHPSVRTSSKVLSCFPFLLQQRRAYWNIKTEVCFEIQFELDRRSFYSVRLNLIKRLLFSFEAERNSFPREELKETLTEGFYL